MLLIVKCRDENPADWLRAMSVDWLKIPTSLRTSVTFFDDLRSVFDRIRRPVLQEPVLGAADSERRNCPGVRGVLSEVPEASMSAAAAMRAYAELSLHGLPP